MFSSPFLLFGTINTIVITVIIVAIIMIIISIIIIVIIIMKKIQGADQVTFCGLGLARSIRDNKLILVTSNKRT